MTGPRFGALFAGVGGLEMGVQAVLGGTTAWHSEHAPAPPRVLAHHWPTVPNLGDITTVDWAAVEPVDIITWGSPCQDLSAAGTRSGMRDGTRSGLWASMALAVSIIRPSLVVWENVRGALSACAHSDLVDCPGCVGDGDHVPVLRALGRVLGDLAGMRYDAWWVGVRASDAGAPHQRFRVFVFAWPTDTDGVGRERVGDAWGRVAPDPGCDAWAEDDPHRSAAGRCGRVAAHPSGDGRHERWPESAGEQGGSDAPQRGDAPVAHPERVGVSGRGGLRDVGSATPGRSGEGVQRERDRDAADDRGTAASDAGVERRDRRTGVIGDGRHPTIRGEAGDHPCDSTVAWGVYGPAIARWESVLGRPAPAPTEPGKTGQPRLSPAFVEWMVGFEPGHVTDPAIGLSRTEQLTALGNVVVPQQAALATRLFLAARRQLVAS